MSGLFNKFKKEKDYFEATSTFGSIKVDDTRRIFKLAGKLIPYADLVSFELIEDGKTITEGGIDIGRAAIGGAFFGTTGAGFGGFSKMKKEDKEFCTSMQVLVTLRNQKRGTLTVPFIIMKTDKSKTAYSLAKTNAKATLSGLNYIVEMNADKTISGFDNLKKLKELFDLGILTKDEYDSKKKDILGI
ncbi:SHOCT domain-containing protein [Jeotgalibaca porci]|uniref:SHOCT domain-containing protein n=1 Tax=Jeotgalibaca porci TaxID=1868793 RepID=UPI00359FE2A6